METITRTATSAIIELIEAFDFEKVEKVMIATDWKWAFSKELRTPTIDEMRDKCLSLLICADRDIDTVSSGGFEASCKLSFTLDSEEPKLACGRKVFTLKFIATWNYSKV